MSVVGTITRQTMSANADLDPSQIDNLLDAVSYACSAALSGAKVSKTAEGIVSVCDSPTWNNDYTTILHLIRPTATISITSSSHSLSGFQVVVHESPAASMMPRLFIVCAAALCAIAFAAWTLSSAFAIVSKSEL